jgi:hypothetical protein
MESKTTSDVKAIKNMRKAILEAVKDEKFKEQLVRDPARAIDDQRERLKFGSSELDATAIDALKSLTDEEIRALSKVPDIARRGGYEPLEFF